jgi:hypothetical protein
VLTQEWLTIDTICFWQAKAVITYSTNTTVADYLALCVFDRSHDELWGGEGTLASKVISSTTGQQSCHNQLGTYILYFTYSDSAPQPTDFTA